MSQSAWGFHLEKMSRIPLALDRYRPVIALVEWASQQEWAARLCPNTSHEHILISLPGSRFDRPFFTVDNREDSETLATFTDQFKFSLFDEHCEPVLERWCRPEQAKAVFVTFTHFLHCLPGNHSRTLVLDPLWLTPTVKDLASAIEEEQAYARLPILADALEDAGCTSQEVLGHCREPEHVSGCWVVNRVLGKE